MSTKIYTKGGDKGKTSLIGGTRVPKSHLRIEAYGTVDELNAHIGWVMDLLNAGPANLPGPAKVLPEVQDRLFTIGSSLACDPDKETKVKIPDLKEEDIIALEQEMDSMNAEMPPMKHFILPGGHPAISSQHIARCICRRAERSVVRLHEESAPVEPLVLQYLNRLSDYLFVLARYTAHQWKIPEIPWNPRLTH